MPDIHVLKDIAQNFTDSWVDYGPEICIDDRKGLSLWLNLKINDTQDMRIRPMARCIPGGDDYVLPLKTLTATVINVEDEYFEFTTDEDQKRVISFVFGCVIPYVQFQIKAGLVGVTAGQVLNSNYSLHHR